MCGGKDRGARMLQSGVRKQALAHFEDIVAVDHLLNAAVILQAREQNVSLFGFQRIDAEFAAGEIRHLSVRGRHGGPRRSPAGP